MAGGFWSGCGCEEEEGAAGREEAFRRRWSVQSEGVPHAGGPVYTWKLEDANNHFGEVVRRALAHEPQRVTCNERDAVVVLSEEDYERLAAPRDLVDFLRNSPLAEALAAGDLESDRWPDFGRGIVL
jgi:antitoxin Phd